MTSDDGGLLASCPCETPGHTPSGSAHGGASCLVQDHLLGGPEASSPCFLLGGRKESFLFLLVPPGNETCSHGSETCSQPCCVCARARGCTCACVRVRVCEGWGQGGRRGREGALAISSGAAAQCCRQSQRFPIRHWSVHLSTYPSPAPRSALMEVLMSQPRMRFPEGVA